MGNKGMGPTVTQDIQGYHFKQKFTFKFPCYQSILLLMIGKMHWISLLILAMLLLMDGCHGQKVPKDSGKVTKHSDKGSKPAQETQKDSVKVPKDSGKMRKNSVKISTNHGKMPAQIADGKSVYSLFQEYGQKILGKNSKHNEQLKKLTEGINKKQCLLEAVFAKNSKKNIYSNEKEFKFFKKRWDEIYQNDPPLSQLLEGLFAAVIRANEAMKKENSNKLSTRKNELKQSLAYAVFFMAKRGKISLESPRGERTNEPKAILIELIDIYNDLQLDIEKAIKSWQKGKKENGQKGERKNEQNGKEKHDQKERRFFQFVSRSLEIEWDANAFCVDGQNGNDDDDDDKSHILDDAIGGRRRRRRKRMDNNYAPEPPTASVGNFFGAIRTVALIVIGILVVLFVLCYFTCHSRHTPSQQRATGVASMPNHSQSVTNPQ